MVGGHDDSRDRQGVGVHGGALWVRAGRVGMAVGGALCIGGGVEEGRAVGVAALGYGGAGVGSVAEFGLCLSGLDPVQYAVSGVGGDALDLPSEAKLAVDEGDVVELVDGECDGERGVSWEEVGEVGAEAGVVGGLGREERGRRAGRDGEAGDGLERGRAVSRRVGHGSRGNTTSTPQRPPRPQIPAQRAQPGNFASFFPAFTYTLLATTIYQCTLSHRRVGRTRPRSPPHRRISHLLDSCRPRCQGRRRR